MHIKQVRLIKNGDKPAFAIILASVEHFYAGFVGSLY